MKILVLAENYPSPNGSISLQYIHSRNMIYIKKGIDVSVISFRAIENYELDGIKIYTLKAYEENLKNKEYDILISHAPNLKNHFKFLKKYDDNFKDIVFFFHGHEVLKTSKVYSKPFNFVKSKSSITYIKRDLYDIAKLKIWKKYFEKIAYKAQFVFVSEWMYDMFVKFVGIDPKIIEDKKHIIYNCVGEQFEYINYNVNSEKEYDFITIRGNLDGSKYGIDIVNSIAYENPQYRFCIVGKGDFFKYNKKSENVDWIDKNLTHEEVIEFLNKSRYALLPTRTDSQGVMACEMATFGIPLITSDISVCKEVFEGFKNVGFIDNNDENIDIDSILRSLQNKNRIEKNEKYFSKNTVDRELGLFRELKE